MTKQEELDKLDDLVRRQMIHLVETGKTDILPELATAVNYLAKNNIIAEKAKSTVEEKTQERVKKANARRAKKEAE